MSENEKSKPFFQTNVGTAVHGILSTLVVGTALYSIWNNGIVNALPTIAAKITFPTAMSISIGLLILLVVGVHIFTYVADMAASEDEEFEKPSYEAQLLEEIRDALNEQNASNNIVMGLDYANTVTPVHLLNE
jgi:large-conductance mechanosensitive channel